MSVYQTAEGWGVDYRDEYGRRRRHFVGSEEAARVLENRIREEAARAKESRAPVRGGRRNHADHGKGTLAGHAAGRRAAKGQAQQDANRVCNAIILPEFFAGVGVWAQSSQARIYGLPLIFSGKCKNPTPNASLGRKFCRWGSGAAVQLRRRGRCVAHSCFSRSEINTLSKDW